MTCSSNRSGTCARRSSLAARHLPLITRNPGQYTLCATRLLSTSRWFWAASACRATPLASFARRLSLRFTLRPLARFCHFLHSPPSALHHSLPLASDRQPLDTRLDAIRHDCHPLGTRTFGRRVGDHEPNGLQSSGLRSPFPLCAVVDEIAQARRRWAREHCPRRRFCLRLVAHKGVAPTCATPCSCCEGNLGVQRWAPCVTRAIGSRLQLVSGGKNRLHIRY